MRYLSVCNLPENRLSTQQLIREDNLKRLFNLLNGSSGLSRVELSRLARLSPTTVSALVDDLVRDGLALETGYARVAQTGRRPIGLRIDPDARQLPVFSLNRWGVRYSLLNLDCRTLETMFVSHLCDRYPALPREQAASRAGADYAQLFEDVLTRRSRLYDPARAAAVLICFPGIYLEEDEVYSMSAMGVSLPRASLAELEGRLGVPLFLGNSSLAMAYAEKKRLDGAGAPVEDLMYVNVCEGVGAGILIGGEIFLGANGHAGEIGHISVDFRGQPCFCGGRGCLEQYVSLDAILERVKRTASEGGCTRLLDMAEDSYDNISLEMIGRAFDEGVEPVRAALEEIARMLFTAVYSAVCVTGVRRVVIGGGIERLGAGFLDRLRALCANKAGELMPGMRFSYGQTGFRGDSLGIAQYFVDRAFFVTSGGEA